MMELIRYLSVLCLVFQLAVGHNPAKNAIEVFPCPLREHAGANLTTELKNPLVQSLSLCLKVNIRSWADMIFLAEMKSFHLYLSPYDSGIGRFTFHDNFVVEFVWKHVWSVSGKAWNSICFAFDATRQSFMIAINGEVVKGFKIKRGVKQGDALSCILFIMCMEPLLLNLERNVEIKPIRAEKINAHLPKVYAYADDVNTVIKNDEGSLQAVFNEYNRLTKLSGLELNADKTELMRLKKATRMAQQPLTFEVN